MSHEPGLPLGIGLIGVGHHGSRYAKHLLQDLPEALLAAVSRRRTAGGNGLASAPAVPCYPDYHEFTNAWMMSLLRAVGDTPRRADTRVSAINSLSAVYQGTAGTQSGDLPGCGTGAESIVG